MKTSCPKARCSPHKSAKQYKKVEGHLTGVKDFGTIIRVTMVDHEGDHHEFFGDRRMVLSAIEGMERNHPITINYSVADSNEWYIERD